MTGYQEDIDPDVFYEGALGDALETLDTVVAAHDEEITLEVAEDSVYDLQQGIDDYAEMTFYTDRSLDDLQRELPGSTFSELSDPRRERLLADDGDVTLWLVFESSHVASVPVDTVYDALDIRVPTAEAANQELYETVQDVFTAEDDAPADR